MMVSSVTAYFPANESSYLNFHIPHSLRHNETYRHRSAMFGSHYTLWGQEGSMVLPVKLALGDMDLCWEPSPKTVQEWKLPKDSAYILMAERGGDCTFVKKVRTAQIIGAAAVLIADSSDHLPDTMANDGSGQDISIPSMLIGKDTYEQVKKVLEMHNHTGHVVAELAWHTPKFENRVVLDFWHSPIDTHIKEFMANFSTLAQSFDLSTNKDDRNDLLEFRAHPILLDGKEMGCMFGSDETPNDPCYELCTNGGRYCHVSHRHTQGRDIVKEALRRLCISHQYPNQHVYWTYLNFFSEHCWDSDYFANDACILDAFKHAEIDQSKINDCIEVSGNPAKDDLNSFLQEQLEKQKHMGIITSPTLLINRDRTMLWGGLTPRNVLTALCETFEYGEKPHVCYACMTCGDPVACAQRSPMKCEEGDGKETEDPNAHKNTDHHPSTKKKSHWGRWLFGMMLVGGCVGAFIYYKKQQDGVDGLGSYSLQDAFLTDSG
ncbi:PA domain containing protein [Nitzschia inconspicua]|uniref:PA domain containing protein n=1 Tax=Nitzschia inconspicua TaxID=303405 RepID=A0A9K3KFF0_9STRA|nr:PA domain containing protein [Nitzschia inconspicua]